MIHAGARYVDEEVAVDGNLITSRKPTGLPVFCRQTAAALSGRSVAQPAAGKAEAQAIDRPFRDKVVRV